MSVPELVNVFLSLIISLLNPLTSGLDSGLEIVPQFYVRLKDAPKRADGQFQVRLFAFNDAEYKPASDTTPQEGCPPDKPFFFLDTQVTGSPEWVRNDCRSAAEFKKSMLSEYPKTPPPPPPGPGVVFKVQSPVDGSTVNNPIVLSLQTVTFIKKAIGEHHFHVTVDERPMQHVYQKSLTLPFLSPGLHRVRVSLGVLPVSGPHPEATPIVEVRFVVGQ